MTQILSACLNEEDEEEDNHVEEQENLPNRTRLLTNRIFFLKGQDHCQIQLPTKIEQNYWKKVRCLKLIV